MKVQVTKSFKWAPDGLHTRDVQVGELLEGRGAEVALDLGCCDRPAQGPTAKALGAPKNKGR